MFRRIILLSLFCAVLLTSQPLPFTSNVSSLQDTIAGPYLDQIEYKIITQEDAQVAALLDDEIDIIGADLAPEYYSQLENAEDIEVTHFLENGYGQFVINCNKYPYNITDFRRAIAIGLNKTYIIEEVLSGEGFEIDSVLPRQNPFSIEGKASLNYYNANISLANETLEAAGFTDINGDGYREAPNGSELIVEIESVGSETQKWKSCHHLADTLHAMGIQYSGFHDNFGYTLALERMIAHQDFDIVFIERRLSDLDASWIGYDFWSNYSTRPHMNWANFKNQTFDVMRDTFLHSINPSQVMEVGYELQEILLYECPVIPCYQKYSHIAHRTDRFDGFTVDLIGGAASWWVNQKVHLKPEAGGPWGGTLRRSHPLYIDTFNILKSTSGYTWDIIQMLYDSLLRMSPEGNSVNWLARNYVIETHQDNPTVPDGHTRIVFDIIYWGAWSDGHPITADDIAFTLNFYKEHPDIRFGYDLEDMISASAPTPYKLVVEFSTESYWHLHKVAFKPILPKNFFSELDWRVWDPKPPQDAMVTSGSFIVSECVAGEHIILSHHDGYMFDVHSTTTIISSDCRTFNTPNYLAYVVGSTGNEVSWSVNGSFPSSYMISNQTTILETGMFYQNETLVQLDVDDLPLGLHYLTLQVKDQYGQSHNHTVRVEVLTQEEYNLRVALVPAPWIIFFGTLFSAIFILWKFSTREGSANLN